MNKRKKKGAFEFFVACLCPHDDDERALCVSDGDDDGERTSEGGGDEFEEKQWPCRCLGRRGSIDVDDVKGKQQQQRPARAPLSGSRRCFIFCRFRRAEHRCHAREVHQPGESDE